MIQDDLNPYPLSQISTFGHPFHGLVSGGSLTLPNGAVISYQQPEPWWYDFGNGSTDVLKIPGVPAVERTTEQAELDTAEGYQWWNYALLSGDSRQLYGTSLSTRWVYVDPAGDRWLVNTSGMNTSFNTGNTLVVNVTLIRFGDVSPEPEQHVYQATLADVGQNVARSTRLSTDSVSPQGNKAIGVFRANTGSSDFPYPANDHWFAVGAVQLEISGEGASATVGLSVLRTEDAMYGGSETYTGSGSNYTYDVDSEYVLVSGSEPCTSGDIWTYESMWTEVVPTPVGPGPNTYWSGSEQHDYDLFAIAGLFFDPDTSAVVEIRVETSGSMISEWPHPSIESQTGSHEIDYYVDNDCNITGFPVETRNSLHLVVGRTSTRTTSGTVRVKIGAHQISRSANATCQTHNYVTIPPGVSTYTVNSIRTGSATAGFYSPPAINDTVSLETGSPFSGAHMSLQPPNVHVQPVGIGWLFENDYIGTLADMGLRIYTGASVDLFVMAHMYSNRVAGLSAAWNGTKLAGSSRQWQLGAVFEWGSESAVLPSENSFLNVYGSANPVTQEVVWGQASEVCFV